MKYETAKAGYTNLFAKMKIRPERISAAQAIARKLAANKVRYEVVAKPFGCPWWFVAVIHQLEGAANFSTHLHNGDPLTSRTVHVPAGRPAVGSPPFTWEASAADALTLQGIDKVPSWELPRCLYELERYNGWGYLGKVNSPYLWSMSDLYTTGKYVADGVWSSGAVSEQYGAAVILRALMDLKLVEESKDPMSELKDFLGQFARIAPTLVTVIAGPGAGLAVKALAEAMTNDNGVDTGGGLLPSDPKVVVDKLESSPLSTVIAVISAAEQIVQLVAHTPAPVPVAPVIVPPVVVAPPAEVTTVTTVPDREEGNTNALDKLFPSLVGWKLYIGLAIYVLGHVAAVLAPTLVTPDILTAITWIATGIAGAGAISKIDRYISIFKPSVKTTVVTNK